MSRPLLRAAAPWLAALLLAVPSTTPAAADPAPGTLLVFTCRTGQQWDLFAWDPADTGPPRRLTDTPHDELAPSLAPDRRSVVYGDSAGHLWHQELDAAGHATGERRRLDAPGETNRLLQPAVHPDGGAVLLALRADRSGDDTDLVVRRLDGSEGATDAVPLPHGPAWESVTGESTARPAPTRRLGMLSSQFSPAWAPDGLRFAFTNLHARWTGSLVSEIWEARLDHSHARQLTLLDAFCDQPAWAPDGTAVAFSCDRPDQYELYRVSLPGRRVDRLTDHPARDTDPAYAPDGRRLVFVSTRGGGEGLYLLPLAADGTPGDAIPLDPFPGEERPCQAPDWR